MKPSELFEGENSSLKKTYDEATKTLEEILEVFTNSFPEYGKWRIDRNIAKTFIIDAYSQGFQAGQEDGMKGKVFNKVEITEKVNIPKELHDKIFQAGKDSMKEEIRKKQEKYWNKKFGLISDEEREYYDNL